MKLIRVLGFSLLILAVVSCSTDNAPGSEEEQLVLPDFRLIGEDTEHIFQYSYDSSSKSGIEVNLTQGLGLDPQYLTLRQVGEVVSFYSFSSGSFSLIQQNTLTGQSVSYPDFYTVTEERAITWGANSEDMIFLGFYSPKGSRDFGVRSLDPRDGSFTDLPLALDIQQAFDPLYFRQRLIITYRDGSGSYKIAIFNTESRSLILTLDYGNGIPTILIDDMDNLGILIGAGNSQFVYQVLDIETLDEISEISFEMDEFLPAGPLKGSVSGTTLYYTNFFPQPAEVSFGPAYFDFAKDENFNIDILSIVWQVESETQSEIDLTATRFYEEAEVFLTGYADAGSQSELSGGVLVISKGGLLLDRIELPFVPTYFLKP